MCEVPLVTCRFTKITINFSLPAGRSQCRVMLPGQWGSFDVRTGISSIVSLDCFVQRNQWTSNGKFALFMCHSVSLQHLEPWATDSFRFSLLVHELDHTHYWKLPKEPEMESLQIEKNILCTRWRKKAEKWTIWCWPQLQPVACTVTPTHLPLNFCRTYLQNGLHQLRLNLDDHYSHH